MAVGIPGVPDFGHCSFFYEVVNAIWPREFQHFVSKANPRGKTPVAIPRFRLSLKREKITVIRFAVPWFGLSYGAFAIVYASLVTWLRLIHRDSRNLREIIRRSKILEVLFKIQNSIGYVYQEYHTCRCWGKYVMKRLHGLVAKKRYQAVGFPCNRMLKLSSSRGIRIDVPVLSVSWFCEDHSVVIQALGKGLIEREASDTGGIPRWKSSLLDRLAEAT